MSEDLKQSENEGKDYVIKEDGNLVSGKDYRDRKYAKRYESEVSEKTSFLEKYCERLIVKVDEILA